MGSIAMLPAGLILLMSSGVQFCRGDYIVGQNFYGAPTGPGLRAEMGLVFTCLGAVFLWLTIRKKAKPGRTPDDERTS